MDSLDKLSPEMQADLDAYYDWLEEVSGEQEMPEDYALQSEPGVEFPETKSDLDEFYELQDWLEENKMPE
jgi:hypothetical protein